MSRSRSGVGVCFPFNTVKSRLFRHAVIVFFAIFELATPAALAEGRCHARLRLSGTLVSAACRCEGNIDGRRVDPSVLLYR